MASCSALVLLVRAIDRVLVVRRQGIPQIPAAVVQGRPYSLTVSVWRMWKMKRSGLMVYSLPAWTERAEVYQECRGIPIHVLSAYVLVKRREAH